MHPEEVLICQPERSEFFKITHNILAYEKVIYTTVSQRNGNLSWVGAFVSLVSTHKTKLIMRIQET